MKRSQIKEISMEIMVGAFIFMVLLALGFFTIVLSYENMLRPSYHIEAEFDHVRGLRQGDNVFLRGVMIGRVKSLTVQPDGVRVLATLQQPVRMREGYRVEILPSSVLGGQYLSLYEGPDGAPAVSEDMVFRGTPPVDLMAEATATIQSIREALEEGEILSNIQNSMEQLSRMMDQIGEGRGTIGRLLSDDDTLYEDIASTAAAVREFTEKINQGEGTLGKLIDDDTLYHDVAAVAAAAREFSERINQGEGTLGRLIADDELYDEAKLLLHEIRAAVDDFRETAPITTFTSIFFGAF